MRSNTYNRVDLWRNLCTSLLYFVVRVRCCRKESSRSLSHLLMSFLFFAVLAVCECDVGMRSVAYSVSVCLFFRIARTYHFWNWNLKQGMITLSLWSVHWTCWLRLVTHAQFAVRRHGSVIVQCTDSVICSLPSLDLWSSFLIYRYIFRIFRPNCLC